MKEVVLINQDLIIEENRRLIREIGRDLSNDPVQDIENYDEWLDVMLNSPNNAYTKYGKKFKAKLILRFYKRKIQDKTGILLKKILWHQLPNDGIIHWPKDDDYINISHLPLHLLDDILKRLDQLRLSPDFIKRIQRPRKSRGSESKITKYFRDLFLNELSWGKRIPWDKLTFADFQNWPQDFPIKSPRYLSYDQRKKLHSILETIKLSKHFKDTYQERLGYIVSENKAAISRHLLDIISKRLGVPYGHLPHLKPHDVINWPPLKPVDPFKLSADEANDVFEHLDSLNITEEFIQKLRSKASKPSDYRSKFIEEIRQHIIGLIYQLSGRKDIITIPWKQLTKSSFTWWPLDVPVKNPWRLTLHDLNKLIGQKHQIEFTEEFKEKYLKYLDGKMRN